MAAKPRPKKSDYVTCNTCTHTENTHRDTGCLGYKCDCKEMT